MSPRSDSDNGLVVMLQLWTDFARLIHSVACLRQVHSLFQNVFCTRVRCSSFSFNLQYPLFFSRPSSNCLLLLCCLPVTSIPPPVCPSVTCFRRQFLWKVWPIQLAFFRFIGCSIVLSPWLSVYYFASHTVGPSNLLLVYIPKRRRLRRRWGDFLTVEDEGWTFLRNVWNQ